MPNITVEDVRTIAEYRDTIARQMRIATHMHADAIRAELAEFANKRADNPERWARLVVAKAILSAGADLIPNILLALGLSHALENGATIAGYDDCEPLRKQARYGARSVGQNINRAVCAYNAMLTDGYDMTWEGLRFAGLSHKTRSWALALYDSRNRVYTLDVHMVRNIASLADLKRDGITNAAYKPLADLMLSIHDEVCAEYDPLVSQWSLWNEFRHPNVHASHLLLAS